MSAVENFFEDDSLDESNSSESAEEGISTPHTNSGIYDRYESRSRTKLYYEHNPYPSLCGTL